MRKVLPQTFFDRPALSVAPELLGKMLVHRVGRKERALVITEVEAYVGEHDKACHASHGRTPRTEVMFGPAGVWYVYLVYGIHEMLNVVVDRENCAAAVLIRGGALIDPYLSSFLKARQNYTAILQNCSIVLGGPGKLTRALGVTRRFNAKPAAKSSGLWIEDRGVRVPRSRIRRTPRIGVSYAGAWARKPYRFVLEYTQLAERRKSR